MNEFMEGVTEEKLVEMEEANVLNRVNPEDLGVKGPKKKTGPTVDDETPITNDTQKNYDKFKEDEFKDLEVTEGLDAEGQKAQKRRDEKKKVDAEIRKRNKELKDKIGKKPRKTFKRDNMNQGFFANAQANKDLGVGWAMDFTTEESGANV
jgi:hypothetical protein